MKTVMWIAFGLCVAACGGDDLASKAAVASNAGSGSKSGDAGSASWMCDFAGEIARRAGVSATDLGTVAFSADVAAMQAAQKQVLDALAAKQAFVLRANIHGTDSYPVDAYTSDGVYASLVQDDSDPANQRETVEAQLCETLEIDPNCILQSGGGLCLRCKGPFESAAECVPPFPNDNCNHAGFIDTHVYRPCCPGLRGIYPITETTDQSGATSCKPSQIMQMACIEGRCGDGRCEDGERQPCGGCTLDCK